MACSVVCASSPQLCQVATIQALDAPNSRRFLLVPTKEEIDPWRRFLANTCPQLSFGTKILTINQYASENWTLFGDGRTPIQASYRLLLLAHVLETPSVANPQVSTLRPSLGLIKLLARVVSEGLGVERFDALIDGERETSCNKAHVWQAVADYRDLLSAKGLIDYAQMLAILTSHIPPTDHIVCVGYSKMSPAELRFVKAVADNVVLECPREKPAFTAVESLAEQLAGDPQLVEYIQKATDEPESQKTNTLPYHRHALQAIDDLESLETNSDISALLEHLYCKGSALKPSPQLSFAMSAGQYAEPQLITRIVLDELERGTKSFRIVAKDVCGIFDKVAPRLAIAKVGCKVSYSQGFFETLFGQALQALVNLSSPSSASDFTLSPFSGIDHKTALDLDTRWRACRNLQVEAIERSIENSSAQAGRIIAAYRLKDYCTIVSAMMESFEGHAANGHASMSALDNALSVKAASRARKIFECASALEFSVESAFNALEAETICVSCASSITSKYPLVNICTLEELAMQPCEVALFTGLTALEYPVSADDDAAVFLLEQAGIDIHNRQLETMRYAFYCALRAVKNRAIFERCLNDSDANPLRMSVLLEEVADCFRDNLESLSDIDKTTGLPICLTNDDARTRGIYLACGEEDIDALLPPPAGACSPICDDRARIIMPAPLIGAFDEEYSHCTPWNALREQHFGASQIEAYLDCPYKWFSSWRLNPQALDAAISPREIGSFTHEVMQNFYQKFSPIGASRRVSFETLDEAHILLDQVFDELCEEHRRLDEENACSGLKKRLHTSLLVATGELEQKQIEQQRKKLHEFLKEEVRFLPRFVPNAYEISMDAEDLEYAGYRFKGRIDRIDVDQNGRAVIVDYKYSDKSLYDINYTEEEGLMVLPPRVQALIYAQVLKRSLGYEVVGSLFRFCNNPAQVRGAFDAHVIGHEDICGAKACGFPSEKASLDFSDLLDRTEERIGVAFDRLIAGDIAPSPSHSEACAYCPVLNCGQRIGV